MVSLSHAFYSLLNRPLRFVLSRRSNALCNAQRMVIHLALVVCTFLVHFETIVQVLSSNSNYLSGFAVEIQLGAGHSPRVFAGSNYARGPDLLAVFLFQERLS